MRKNPRLTFSGSTREKDSWLSSEELRQCRRADEAEPLRSPVPTRHVSNGEYMPLPQSDAQRRVEARVGEIADETSSRLNMSRRQFLAGTGGLAASFLAMNQVHGQFFDVSENELYEHGGGHGTSRGAPSNLFVFDDQLHVVRGSASGAGFALRAIAQGPTTPGFDMNPFNPEGFPDENGDVWGVWNPDLVGSDLTPAEFELIQWVQDVYLDSQVTIGLLSNVTAFSVVAPTGEERPGRSVEEARPFEILTAEQTAAVRDFINGIAGSRRCMAHGLLYTGPGNLHFIQEQIDLYGPDSWKGYNISFAAKMDNDPDSFMQQWRLDQEDAAYPTYELISANYAQQRKEHPGQNTICVHKGLVAEATPPDPKLGHPGDIPKAATDWPNLNFVIYHSCIKPSFFMGEALKDLMSGRHRDGVPDIEWTTEFAQLAAPFPNVYAELGTTWASMIVTFPTVAAHVMGQLLKYLGPNRIIFGSDSPWYGSPQWQIDALWRFQIPESLQRAYGYPELTRADKRKILGLNAARLYKVPAAAEASDKGKYRPVPADYESRISDELKTLLEFEGFTADNFARMREAYVSRGIQRRDTRYGWIRA